MIYLQLHYYLAIYTQTLLSIITARLLCRETQDVDMYFNQGNLHYVDSGMNISMRTDLLFQVKATTGWAIGFRSQPFTATDYSLDYTFIMDRTDSINAPLIGSVIAVYGIFFLQTLFYIFKCV